MDIGHRASDTEKLSDCIIAEGFRSSKEQKLRYSFCFKRESKAYLVCEFGVDDAMLSTKNRTNELIGSPSFCHLLLFRVFVPFICGLPFNSSFCRKDFRYQGSGSDYKHHNKAFTLVLL